MKSFIITAMLTTLVAAVPPPPASSDQPATGLALGDQIADATNQVTEKGPCYKQCKSHCLKIWAIGTWPWPITWPFVIWRCVHKCNKKCKYENEDGYAGNGGDYDDEDGNKDTILHFASMLQANGTDEVDMEKLKEALDMDMDMDMDMVD
ncbi:hypothetical protein KCU99_g9953, partial [Aureobasidium melanogenum]